MKKKKFVNLAQHRAGKLYAQEPRKPIPKAVREKVLIRFNGRCGYCGCLAKKLCIDHIVPVADKRYHGDHNEEKNLMPACFTCNNYKTIFSLEEFRKELSLQVERARAHSLNFRLAEKFGLIFETDRKVIFYFEKLEEK